MFSLSTLIIAAIASAGVGAAITLVILRNSNRELSNRDLTQRLEQSENDLKDYQQEVSDHFSQTADLINNLTRDYKEVHEHLANSALKLSNAELSRAFLESANSQLPTGEAAVVSEEKLEPPRDWAPKSPGKKGALSEDYGLDEERENIAANTTPTA